MCERNFWKWRRYVTVEPCLFLYMFGVFLFYPLQQNMVFSSYCNADKECQADVQSNSSAESKCGRISSVSAHTSHFIFYLTLSSILPGALTTFLAGRWSDSAGRKIVIAMPVAGAAANAIVSMLVFEFNWSIDILLAGGLMSGLMGSYAMFNQASFAYVADISSPERRTIRLGYLEAMIYLGMTLGAEVGGIWTQRNGYGPPFWGVVGIQLLVLVYVACFLKESPIHQVSGRPGTAQLKLTNIFHGVRLFTRPDPGRRIRIAVLVAFVLATINFNALIDVTIPYLRDEPFKWSFDLIGHYLALTNFMHGISAIAILPLLKRVGLSDMVCIQIGIFSSMVSLIILGLAQNTWLLFMVPLVGTLRGMVVPCVRSSLSKLVSAGEHGALFSSVAVVEIMCTIIASLVYNNAYPATCGILPSSKGFVFLLMSACLIPALILFWWLGKQALATAVDSHAHTGIQVEGLSVSDVDSPLVTDDSSDKD